MTTSFVPIPGLSATFFVDPQNTNNKCYAILTSTFNATEFFLEVESSTKLKRGGSDTDGDLIIGRHEEIESIAARYAAFVNGNQVPGTERFIHARFSLDTEPPFDLTSTSAFIFKQISISCIITLKKGINDVSIRVKPEPDLNTTFRDGVDSTASGVDVSGNTIYTSHTLLGHILTQNGHMHVETLIK